MGDLKNREQQLAADSENCLFASAEYAWQQKHNGVIVIG